MNHKIIFNQNFFKLINLGQITIRYFAPGYCPQHDGAGVNPFSRNIIRFRQQLLEQVSPESEERKKWESSAFGYVYDKFMWGSSNLDGSGEPLGYNDYFETAMFGTPLSNLRQGDTDNPLRPATTINRYFKKNHSYLVPLKIRNSGDSGETIVRLVDTIYDTNNVGDSINTKSNFFGLQGLVSAGSVFDLYEDRPADSDTIATGYAPSIFRNSYYLSDISQLSSLRQELKNLTDINISTKWDLTTSSTPSGIIVSVDDIISNWESESKNIINSPNSQEITSLDDETILRRYSLQSSKFINNEFFSYAMPSNVSDLGIGSNYDGDIANDVLFKFENNNNMSTIVRLPIDEDTGYSLALQFSVNIGNNISSGDLVVNRLVLYGEMNNVHGLSEVNQQPNVPNNIAFPVAVVLLEEPAIVKRGTNNNINLDFILTFPNNPSFARNLIWTSGNQSVRYSPNIDDRLIDITNRTAQGEWTPISMSRANLAPNNTIVTPTVKDVESVAVSVLNPDVVIDGNKFIVNPELTRDSNEHYHIFKWLSPYITMSGNNPVFDEDYSMFSLQTDGINKNKLFLRFEKSVMGNENPIQQMLEYWAPVSSDDVNNFIRFRGLGYENPIDDQFTFIPDQKLLPSGYLPTMNLGDFQHRFNNISIKNLYIDGSTQTGYTKGSVNIHNVSNFNVSADVINLNSTSINLLSTIPVNISDIQVNNITTPNLPANSNNLIDYMLASTPIGIIMPYVGQTLNSASSPNYGNVMNENYWAICDGTKVWHVPDDIVWNEETINNYVNQSNIPEKWRNYVHWVMNSAVVQPVDLSILRMCVATFEGTNGNETWIITPNLVGTVIAQGTPFVNNPPFNGNITISNQGGRASELIEPQLLPHSHTIMAGVSNGTTNSFDGNTVRIANEGVSSNSEITTNSTDGTTGQMVNNVQPTTFLNYIIKIR